MAYKRTMRTEYAVSCVWKSGSSFVSNRYTDEREAQAHVDRLCRMEAVSNVRLMTYDVTEELLDIQVWDLEPSNRSKFLQG